MNCSLHTAHTENRGHYYWSCHSVLHENTEQYVEVSLPTVPCCVDTDIWTSSYPNRTASLLVTVQSDVGSTNIASTLSTWFSSVASSATVEPLQIVRYGAPEANYYIQHDIPTNPVHFTCLPSTPLTQMAAQKKFYHYWAQAYFLLKILRLHTHGQRQR